MREEQEKVRNEWQKEREDAEKKDMLAEKLRGGGDQRKSSRAGNSTTGNWNWRSRSTRSTIP